MDRREPDVLTLCATVWRGARAVEWDGLENRCRELLTVGSNPTPSASPEQNCERRQQPALRPK